MGDFGKRGGLGLYCDYALLRCWCRFYGQVEFSESRGKVHFQKIRVMIFDDHRCTFYWPRFLDKGTLFTLDVIFYHDFVFLGAHFLFRRPHFLKVEVQLFNLF